MTLCSAHRCGCQSIQISDHDALSTANRLLGSSLRYEKNKKDHFMAKRIIMAVLIMIVVVIIMGGCIVPLVGAY